MYDVLEQAVAQKASDILLVAGLPVAYKMQGVITRVGERLLPSMLLELVEQAYDLAKREMTVLKETGDDDFSFGIPKVARFRVNALQQRGTYGLVIRVVSFALPDPEKLGIPERVMDFAKLTHGLVLFTGTAGSGKTTSLACLIDRINSTRNAHVVTIEDPIEYLHQHKMGVVTQRELSLDTKDYQTALRAALREIPDVILVGEMRDAETIRAAVTAAETGHLVLSTLHTIGAANTIDRIIDAFDSRQQQQIRTQLAQVLEGVVSQQLVSTVNGNLAPAFEIMTMTNAVRNVIRESKAHQLDSLISSSAAAGMISMDQSLLELARTEQITAEQAIHCAADGEWLRKKLG